MDDYSFDDGGIRHQMMAARLKERLRACGYRLRKSQKAAVQTKKKGVKKDKPNKVVPNPIKVGSDCSG